MSRPAAAGVTCVGGAVIDRKLYLLAPAVPGTSNPATSGRCFGGVARNVAENLARLGVPVALVTTVGDDPGGNALRAGLQAVGVATAGVRVVPGAHTAQYVAVLGPDRDLVIGVAAMDVLEAIGAADVQAAWPAAGGWLVLDTNPRPEVLAKALGRARQDGVPVAVDAVSTAKATRLPADLGGITVLFCNRDEARAWLARHTGDGAGDDTVLVRRLRAAGAAGVVLTRGAGGALVAGGDGVRELPAAPSRPADVTGAGDALVAGTVAGLLHGEDLAAAVRRGMVLAALTVAGPDSVRADLDPALLVAAMAAAGLAGLPGLPPQV